jgi:putative ABC transport system substrate-binding protein
MSYSSDLDAAYRDVIVLMAKILKGRNPADLPVQLPTRFRLNVNLKTARRSRLRRRCLPAPTR